MSSRVALTSNIIFWHKAYFRLLQVFQEVYTYDFEQEMNQSFREDCLYKLIDILELFEGDDLYIEGGEDLERLLAMDEFTWDVPESFAALANALEIYEKTLKFTDWFEKFSVHDFYDDDSRANLLDEVRRIAPYMVGEIDFAEVGIDRILEGMGRGEVDFNNV